MQSTIHRKPILNFKLNNFAMNDKYTNCDEDLFTFRDDMMRLNDEIKTKKYLLQHKRGTKIRKR